MPVDKTCLTRASGGAYASAQLTGWQACRATMCHASEDIRQAAPRATCRHDDRQRLPGRDEALGLCGAARLARQQPGAPHAGRDWRVPGPRQGLEGQEDGRPHGRQAAHRAVRVRVQGAPRARAPSPSGERGAKALWDMATAAGAACCVIVGLLRSEDTRGAAGKSSRSP